MAQNKEKYCRNCLYWVWGWSRTNQQSKVKVCAKKPKTIQRDTSGKEFHYSVNQSDSCDEFKKR